MLSQRQLKLLQLLKQEPVPQRIEYFVKKLGVSERSLYSDIEALQKTGIRLEKKRGVGIRLLTEEDRNLSDSVQDAQWLRRLAIINTFLLEQSQTSLNDLSEHYFVSKTSIKQDIAYISDTLLRGGKGSFVSDRKGTRLIFPSVEDRLNALARFYQLLTEEGSVLQEQAMADGKLYCQSDVVGACKNILYTYIREHVDTLSDVYIQNFLSLFVAQVSLLMENQHITRKKNLFEQKQHAFYIESAVRLLHKASLRLGFNYYNEDVAYLSEQLLLHRFEQASSQLVDRQIVHDLIEKVSQTLEVDFSRDMTLLTQLQAHIPPMLSRLKYKTYIRNPFVEQIKLECSLVFNVLWLVMADFGQEIGVVFNEDEIAFLTIYFQLALEQSGISRKILVVCQTGIVTSQLLISRIKQSLPSLDRVDVASSREVEELDIATYDVVLSTVPLDVEGEKIYFVSPFIGTDELADLLQQGKEMKSLKGLSSEEGLENYLRKELIFFHPQLHSTTEAIDFISQELFKRGLVHTGFRNAMVAREELGNTDLPIGIAIPHGNPQEVEKTFVALIKCPKKFKWKDYFIDLIFVIGVHPNDMTKTKAIVSNIYALTQSEQALKNLRQAKSRQEVENIVYQSYT